MSYKRKIQKLNIENFLAWQQLMNLHLTTIGDTSLYYLENKYVAPPKDMTKELMFDINNHKNMAIDIATFLIYSKFDEVKHYPIVYDMWKKL